MIKLPRVFLSYASTNDSVGWVTEFREKLEHELDRACGERGVIKHLVFQDQAKLARNDHFERELPEELKESNVLVALISKEFLNSRWCGVEGTQFLKGLEAKFGAEDAGRAGVFVVDLDNTWTAAQEPTMEGDQQTVSFVQHLRATIAGTYRFWAPLQNGPGGARRICEPTYARIRDDDPDRAAYDSEMTRLADQLGDHLAKVSRRLTSGCAKPHVLLIPPCRPKGMVWKDFVSLWGGLAKNSRLSLVPLRGAPVDNTGSASFSDWSDALLKAVRTAALDAIANAEIVVQLLGPMALDWDPLVLSAAAKMKESIGKGPRRCASSADLDGLKNLIDQENLKKNVCLKDSPEAQLSQVLQPPLFMPFSSFEDLARQISELAASLSSVTLEARNPVLIEATDDDAEMAEEAQDELNARGILYVNRSYFRDNKNMELPLDNIEFASVLYLCDKGASGELVRRATQVTQFLAATGKKAWRAAVFYNPPWPGFRRGYTYAFDEDLPIPVSQKTDKRKALSANIDKFLGE